MVVSKDGKILTETQKGKSDNGQDRDYYDILVKQ